MSPGVSYQVRSGLQTSHLLLFLSQAGEHVEQGVESDMEVQILPQATCKKIASQ